jgi:uncharacterized protein YegL
MKSTAAKAVRNRKTKKELAMSGNVAVSQEAQATQDGHVLSHDLMVEIMGAVPTFAGTKVHVGFHGTGAFCNPRLGYVNIPELPVGKKIPMRHAMAIRGFASHEAGHLLWTDMDAKDRAMSDAERNDPLFHSVWNAIEDYMIERNWLIVYPGSHKNFAATQAHCGLKYLGEHQRNPDASKDLRGIGAVALTWCRAICFGLKTGVPAECLDTMPPTLRARVWQWFHDVIDVESTRECVEAARIIVADILANPFDPNDPPASAPKCNQQSGAGAQQSGTGAQQFGTGAQQSGTGAQQSETGAQQSGTGAQQSGAGAQQPGAGTQQPGAGTQKSGAGGGPGGNEPPDHGPAPTPWKTDASIDDIYREMNIAPTTSELNVVVSSTVIDGPLSSVLSDSAGIARSESVLKTVSGEIGTVSRILRRSLQSLSRDRWKSGRQDGIIDDKKIANVILGSTEVFKKKVQAPEIATAVSILIDCSGSMKGREIAICQQMATILQASFAGTPVRYEIIGFTTAREEEFPEKSRIMVEALKQKRLNPQINAVAIYEFKAFDAPHQIALTTIGNMQMTRMGGTPTGPAILAAHERLSRRQERRHVMMVLTDGEPDNATLCSKAVESVEGCGVTVVAIGIGTRATERCFRNSVTIDKASDVPAVVLSKLQNILFGDKGKVGMKNKIHA